MKYLRTILLFSITGLLFASCAEKQNYPDVPQIAFNSFIPFCSGSVTDSAYLRLNFTDGNGDIGYSAQDSGAPPNCYIIPLIDSLGYFVPIFSSAGTITFSYHIPDITPSGTDKELNGIIQINLESAVQTVSGLPPISGKDFHKLQFRVWIFDRAGNQSNVLITPTNATCQ